MTLDVLAATDEAIVSPAALGLIERLHDELDPLRRELLGRRHERQREFDSGARPAFVTSNGAGEGWKVASAPPDLRDRRCEITGPPDRKMMINALNSGARVFMCDFEDACSPTWTNMVQGQSNLRDAVRRTISLETPEKRYALNDETATLVVRPRGWHLDERHVARRGTAVSASLFDFGLAFFHNAAELLERGSGPYFYLPKLESRDEAALWARAFAIAEDALGIPSGSVRCTVLIETIPAAFEMDAILWELRDYGCALNAGRWDYIFSAIKKFGAVLPDRAQVTMTVPFMRAYTELLVRSCHARGAHALGGMAAFIPSRRDPEANELAFAKVREDKERESGDGFDGTWVAHPDLVPVATEAFDRVLGDRPAQLERAREDVVPDAAALVDFEIPGERDHRGRAPRERLGRRPLPRRVAPRLRRRRDRQPDGGRRHRGDRAGAGLELGARWPVQRGRGRRRARSCRRRDGCEAALRRGRARARSLPEFLTLRALSALAGRVGASTRRTRRTPRRSGRAPWR